MFRKYLIVLNLYNIAKSHTVTNNNSDVFITYSGHAEASPDLIRDPSPNFIQMTSTDNKNILIPESVTTTDHTEFDDTIFVPNDKEIHRHNEYRHPNVMNIGDMMMKKTVDDEFGGKIINVETESPKDIIFVSGKNDENVGKSETRDRGRHTDTRRRGKVTKDLNKRITINCTHLDCNNTANSLCGGKMEHNKWRYRLFLNECYFRKVNCNFKHEENRYIQVKNEHCQKIGAHYTYRPVIMKKSKVAVKNTTTDIWSWRRSFSSRRSQNKGIDGHFCSHACPISCPEDNNPECAVTTNGLRKVFANHCKLDYNSCTNGVVWQKRPLSECVGGKKADLQQNKGFVEWMQRVGIVDKRGRLVLQ